MAAGAPAGPPPRPGLAAGGGGRAGLLAAATAGAVYAVVTAVRLPGLVDQLTWDDATSEMVLAAGLRDPAHGRLLLSHDVATVRLDLLLGHLPAHRLVWQWYPVALAAATIALLVWAVWRLAGGRAAALTAVIATCAPPAVLVTEIAQGYHGPTWFVTAAVAAFLAAVLARPDRSWARLLPLTLAAALLSGIGLISDPLLLVTAIFPLMAAPVLVRFRHRELPAGAMGALTGAGVAALVTAWVLDGVLRATGTTPVSRYVAHGILAGGDHVAHNARLLLGGLSRVAGITPSPEPSAVTAVLGGACGVLSLLALGTVVVRAAVAAAARRGPGLGAVSAAGWLAFWALSVAGVLAAFTLTGLPSDIASLDDAGPSRYLPAVFFAVAAGLPVAVAAGPARRRWWRWSRAAAGFGAALVALTSALRVNAAASDGAFRPAYSRELPAVLSYLDRHDLRHGYGQYWESPALTYASDLRLEVRPVYQHAECGRSYCSGDVNTLGGWYRGDRPGPSFLVIDPALPDLFHLGPPPPGATTAERVGRFTIYVFPFDVARTFRHPS